MSCAAGRFFVFLPLKMRRFLLHWQRPALSQFKAKLLMPTFVVSLRLPEVFDAEFMAIIPRHRTFINQLLADKVVEVYAISSDRSRGWVTINAADAAAVQAVLEQFSLYRYLHSLEIDELFIFDSAAARFPHISLN